MSTEKSGCDWTWPYNAHRVILIPSGSLPDQESMWKAYDQVVFGLMNPPTVLQVRQPNVLFLPREPLLRTAVK
jgi:hypothetical protein